jgi:hypothetical protein
MSGQPYSFFFRTARQSTAALNRLECWPAARQLFRDGSHRGSRDKGSGLFIPSDEKICEGFFQIIDAANATRRIRGLDNSLNQRSTKFRSWWAQNETGNGGASSARRGPRASCVCRTLIVHHEVQELAVGLPCFVPTTALRLACSCSLAAKQFVLGRTCRHLPLHGGNERLVRGRA